MLSYANAKHFAPSFPLDIVLMALLNSICINCCWINLSEKKLVVKDKTAKKAAN